MTRRVHTIATNLFVLHSDICLASSAMGGLHEVASAKCLLHVNPLISVIGCTLQRDIETFHDPLHLLSDILCLLQ